MQKLSLASQTEVLSSPESLAFLKNTFALGPLLEIPTSAWAPVAGYSLCKHLQDCLDLHQPKKRWSD